MSSIRRISNNLMALVAGNGINILQQVAYAPLFIHRYGEAGYGEWLALSASVSYLGTLNFGVQTYVNQDLTLKFQRGEKEGFHVQQSTALRLLLGIVAVGALLATVVFWLPLDHLLRLNISRWEASCTAYLLSLQILINFIYGYLAGNYMVVGRAHRGTNWNNAQRLTLIGLTCAAVWLHASFVTLALVQLASYLLGLTAVLVDIRISAPEIFPSLRHWDRAAVPTILKQSGYFGLITSSTFLAYQVPVLILQRVVGGVGVTIFSLMRTIFSLARQLLNTLTQSMGPEITRLYGQGDWPALVQLYNLSERFIFFLIPVVNLGVFSVSPLLLLLWVHRPNLFVLPLYCVMAAVAFVMCAKEHKFNFQFCTNTHQDLAKIMFFSYVAMGLISLETVHLWGIAGFLWTWLVVESFQTIYILRLNFRLFAAHERVSSMWMVKLAAFGVVGIPAVAEILRSTLRSGMVVRVAAALAVGLVVTVISYVVFEMPEVTRRFVPRILQKFGIARSG